MREPWPMKVISRFPAVVLITSFSNRTAALARVVTPALRIRNIMAVLIIMPPLIFPDDHTISDR
jgi:hypothetical protein